MNSINSIVNNLESEGTDSDISSTKIRRKYINQSSIFLIAIMFTFLQNASANQLHLFSDNTGAIVGTVISQSNDTILIEGYIENNILEAIEIIPSVSNDYINANSDGTGESTDANSDGTGGSNTNANSDGTGGANTNANSDGTGGSNTEANSDGTGGINTYANSDGTGKSLMTVLLACDNNTSSTAVIESAEDVNTLTFDTVYLNKQVYKCG